MPGTWGARKCSLTRVHNNFENTVFFSIGNFLNWIPSSTEVNAVKG